MENQEFINLVCFCILMEGNEGILGKSPSYIREKIKRADPASLDDFNLQKFKEYMTRWGDYI